MIKAKRGLQIILASGRKVYVDLLVIETELAQINTTELSVAELPLLIRRRNMDACENAWFDSGPIHFILPEPFPDDDPSETALVSVLLWSDAVEEGFAFSELMVVFLIEWNSRVPVTRAIRAKLQDLDWDSLAVDRCPRAHIPDEVGAGFSAGSVSEV